MTTTILSTDFSLGQTPTIECDGDSLTAGTGSTANFAYPNYVQYYLPDRIVNINAIGGQTSDQIAARLGGYPINVTLTGGAFTGLANSIVLSAISEQFLSTSADTTTRVVSGNVLGIPCFITRTNSGSEVYTIQPGVASSATIPAATPFIPDLLPNTRNHINVIWAGKNDSTFTNTLANVDSIVQNLKQPRRFIVIGVLPSVNQGLGTTAYNQIIAYNATLQAAYPNNFINSTPPTTAEMAYIGYSPTSGDLIDIANGVFPANGQSQGGSTFPVSMHFDNTHLLSNGYNIIGYRVWQFILANGW